MTTSTHTIGSGRPLHNRPFFDLLTVRLVSYRLVWITKYDYSYECVWSDGTTTAEHTLPWDRLDGAVEAPTCATEGCGKPATAYFEAGGVGSHHCATCMAQIRELAP